ncbi:hypothetical protein Y003_06235 [Staphylococcus aureus MUM475]|nr:hypothetical protein Y003_06235 [Staphylococcus aureus MUM475]
MKRETKQKNIFLFIDRYFHFSYTTIDILKN